MEFLQKNWLQLLCVIVGFFFIWKFFKKDIETETIEATDGISINKFKTTLSKNESDMLASTLLNAMNRIGSDEEAIFNVFTKIKNGEDLKLVIKSFGIKKYYVNGLADGLITSHMGDNLDLQGWFIKELGGDSLERIKGYYSSFNVNFM